MKTTSLALLALVSLFAGARVQAYVVAGWDFSQYAAAGQLTTDGENPATTLDANYSHRDPTFCAGAEAAGFGTLYYDGQFGSSQVVVDGSGFEDVVPSQGSLTSNLGEPLALFDDSASCEVAVPFDSFDVLRGEEQEFANPLGMTAQIQGAVSLVFVADLTSVPETGSDWWVSFGGMTLADSTTVTVDFSTDGNVYSQVDSVVLDTSDARYQVDLSAGSSERAFVRFNFNPAGDEFPIIDNVAINVPEPGAAAQGGVALLALVGARRSIGVRSLRRRP
jgi:hypothetical protein